MDARGRAALLFVCGFVVAGLDHRFGWSRLPLGVVIAIRIRSEERVLEQGLEGYADYKKRVKYRLIPFLW